MGRLTTIATSRDGKVEPEVHEDAPRARSMQDVAPKDTWTVFKIMGEFVEGFETLRPIEPAVSIFGGSRVRVNSRYYRKAVQVAQALAREGFSIITGGGPGIMRRPTWAPAAGAADRSDSTSACPSSTVPTAISIPW